MATDDLMSNVKGLGPSKFGVQCIKTRALSTGTLEMPITDITKDLHMTVQIKGVRVFQWRLTLCAWLIKLAAKVAGIGLAVNQHLEIDCKIKHGRKIGR